MKTVLQTRGLTKCFGPVRAVDGLDLMVRRGEVFGFLGPNGSGKTTTIGMLLGLIHPTAGEAELFGEAVSPQRTRALRRVGALVGAPGLVPYLSGRDHLQVLARMTPGVKNGRVDAVLAQTGLLDAAGRKVKVYSSGMKQRLGLAAALLHRKDVGPEELAAAVRAAARGETVLHPHVATRVMRLVAEGLSNAQIAEQLVLSEKIIKGYVSNILWQTPSS